MLTWTQGHNENKLEELPVPDSPDAAGISSATSLLPMMSRNTKYKCKVKLHKGSYLLHKVSTGFTVKTSKSDK